MDTHEGTTAAQDLTRIVESAQRLGVEIDEDEALQWLAAMAAWRTGADVLVDTHSNVFGHIVAMLDFSPGELARFREIGKLVEVTGLPGEVESALALSGSAAQSKIQSHPGDSDYFQRLNIKAPTREDACRILAVLVREKALETLVGPTYRLIEVKLGSYPFDTVRGSRTYKAGAPIVWYPEEIEKGTVEAFRTDGTAVVFRWDEVALKPDWVKLDWVVADPVREQVANASNVVDVTWEAPDGTITPLDGYLDAYFQEVYLEAGSIPVFSKLARHVSGDALDNYVGQLQHEVHKYLTKDLNYGKAAKRMYNIFRLTGRYHEAAFIRELFDEPATLLYQAWSLVKTLDDAVRPGPSIPIERVLTQAHELILGVIQTLEGEEETTIVRRLLQVLQTLDRARSSEGLSTAVEAARAELINTVNNFFYERLVAVPTIKEYIDGVQQAPEAEAAG